jgi:hypothetical protein
MLEAIGPGLAWRAVASGLLQAGLTALGEVSSATRLSDRVPVGR